MATEKKWSMIYLGDLVYLGGSRGGGFSSPIWSPRAGGHGGTEWPLRKVHNNDDLSLMATTLQLSNLFKEKKNHKWASSETNNLYVTLQVLVKFINTTLQCD